MMRQAIIIGSQGQLGAHLCRALKAPWNILPLTHKDLAIENYQQVAACLNDCRPDVVINASAYNQVDASETQPEQAFKVNAIGPRNLAVACSRLDADLVHVSTDYVFSGQGAPSGGYTEFDPVSPLSVYGRSKLAGEQLVRDHARRFFIVRTSWLFGALAHPSSGKNFVLKLIDLSRQRDRLQIVDDQTGSPTYTADLALKISELIQTEQYGLYHISNAGQATWYRFAQEFLSLVDGRVQLAPCNTEDFPTPAQRPPFSVLSNFMLPLNGFGPMPHWKEAVHRYINDLKAAGCL